MSGPNDAHRTDSAQRPVTRRRFLAGLGATGALAAGGAGYLATRRTDRSLDPSGGDSATGPTSPSGSAAPGEAATTSTTQPKVPFEDRILVIIDQQGGADGLSTLVPYASGHYYDARPLLGVPAADVLPIDGDVGLHPSLSRNHARGVATVEGVGPIGGNLSHFAMQRRWQEGDPTGAKGFRSGLLARVVDEISGDPDRLVGVAVGGGTPFFNNARGANLVVQGIGDLDVLAPMSWWDGAAAFPVGLRAFSPDEPGHIGLAAGSTRTLLNLAQDLADRPLLITGDDQWVVDAGPFGQRMATVADLIAADLGVRVVHVALPGWDTHQGHEFAHGDLLRVIDVAVDGLLRRLEAVGMADRVLVATATEFGRRLVENGNGFDHGVASSMLLLGQGARGRFGEPSPLDRLDADGNLMTTVPFDRYLATLIGEWLGLDAERILQSTASPLGVFG